MAELSAPSGPKICCKNIILSRFDDVFQEDVELDDQDVIEYGDKLTATVLKKQLVSQESQQLSPKENVHNNKEALHQSGKQYQLRQRAPLSYLYFFIFTDRQGYSSGRSPSQYDRQSASSSKDGIKLWYFKLKCKRINLKNKQIIFQ